MALLTDLSDLRRVLLEARTVAVLGAHPDPVRAAHYVPAYLRGQGYRVLPVNPAYAGQTMFDEPVSGTLAGLGADLVVVFRRSEALFDHLDEILAMTPRPGTVWLQQGIRHEGFALRLSDEGIDVVQDACTYALHRRFGLPRVG